MKDHPLVGAVIESVTKLLDTEMSRKHWDGYEESAQINLSKKAGRIKESKGSVFKGRSKYESISLFAAADPELNHPGIVFGVSRHGTGFYVMGGSNDDDAMRGLVILGVRPMTPEELEAQGWQLPYPTAIPPTVIKLSDGSGIFPSQDSEGNGPGIWVVKSRAGEELL